MIVVEYQVYIRTISGKVLFQVNMVVDQGFQPILNLVLLNFSFPEFYFRDYFFFVINLASEFQQLF